jgi:hypothetical protein
LALCEDTKSALLYLKRFPLDPNQVEIKYEGTGMNTDSLMEEAIRWKAAAAKNNAPYDEIWVVYDKDEFPARNFHRAFDLARAHPNIRACWSNECFEIWYLLHFCYRDTGAGREEIWDLVSKHLGKRYNKATNEVFDLLAPKLGEALRNADRLAYANGGGASRFGNPSTRVHELVKVLQKFDPARQTA